MANEVRIDITVDDHKSLDQQSRKAKKTAKEIGESFEQAVVPINRAFDKTARAVGNSLDKIEREAWEAGKGTDAAFQAALAEVRASFDRVSDVGRRTGATLESDLGGALLDVRREAGRLADSLRPVEQAATKVDRAFDKTARSVTNDLDKIRREAWDSGRGMDRAFTDALGDLERRLERARQEARRTGAGLESALGGALRDVKRDAAALAAQMREVDQAAESAGGGAFDSFTEAFSGGGDIGGLFEGLIGGAGAGAGAAGAAAAVGAVMADQAIKGFQRAWSELDLGGTFAASTGSSIQTGIKMGREVGNAFRDGFGDSMEDVAASANAALSRGLAGTPEELAKVTRKIETLGETTGRSAEEIASAARAMVKSGLVDSLDQAFDLMVEGAQRGADAGGDMVETLAQSSLTLKQFGIDGATAIGAMKQSLDAGSPSADQFVDSLEELAGNVGDAIPLFQRLGLGGAEFASALAGGGPKAAQALDQLLDRIRAIPDPAERAQAMVALFGEEATAMQDAILAVDLSAAADDFKDVAGSADEASAALQTFNDPIEMLQREGEGLISGPWSSFFGSITDNADQVEKKLGELPPGLAAFADGADGATESGQAYAQTLQEIVTLGEQMAGGVLTLSEAQISYQDSLAAASESIKENGKNLDLATEAGRTNQGALNDLASSTWDTITAMEQQSASVEEVRGFMEGARAEFIQTAMSMGMSADQANKLADRLGLIPGKYTAEVRVDAGGVEGLLSRIRGSLSSIGGAIANINWGRVYGRQHGGITGSADIWGAASGGLRHSSTMVNEAGPEAINLPNGSTVLPAGTTRALADSGAFSGGGPTQIILSMAGSDRIGRAVLEDLRVLIRNEFGGDVVAALGQGAA